MQCAVHFPDMQYLGSRLHLYNTRHELVQVFVLPACHKDTPVKTKQSALHFPDIQFLGSASFNGGSVVKAGRSR
jgi:hypothetical protein